MFRTRLVVGLATVVVLGLSACGSDSVADKVQNAASDNTGSDITIGDNAGGVTLPEISLPGDLSGDCKAVYAQFLTAMGSALVPGSNVDFAKVFGEAKANVPADLQDDVDVLAAAMQDFAQVMKDHENDMSNPDVMKALQELSTPEVQAASDSVQAYFDATCPQG